MLLRAAKRSRQAFGLSGEDQALENQAPDEIDPAEHDPEEGEHYGYHHIDHAAVAVDDRRPAHEYFGKPVHAGDQQKNDLDESGQTFEAAIY